MTSPNLLLVIADQWRASALGRAAGRDPVRTPVLDALAARSRVLTNAVSNYPVCSPCRAMLMTGQYPWRNGVPFNCNSETAEQGVGLRPDSVCWSDVLAAAGYRLGYIGKWHLDPPTAEDALYGEGMRDDGRVWDAWTPPERRHGFDFWYAHGCCDDHLRPHYWTTDAPRDAPEHVSAWSPEHETDVALGFLHEAAQDERPFALVMSYNPPHQPFDQVPARYLPAYAGLDARDLLTRPNVDLTAPATAGAAAIAQRYFAAITGVDEQIGRLTRELDRLGLTRDTVVVFTSDHGMQLGSHGLMYKNVPFEESMLVPFLVSRPGHIAPGEDDLLLGSPDIAPTLLGLLGLRGDIPASMQGHDLSAALLDEPATPAERPAQALYFGPALAPGRPDVRGLRTRDRKLVVERRPDGTTSTRLFDLGEDRYERSDVAAARPAEVAELSRRLAQDLHRVGDPWYAVAGGPDAPHANAPITSHADTPYAETSYANTFRTDIPGTEAPHTDAPRTGAPHTNDPHTDASCAETSRTDIPGTEAPRTDAPRTDTRRTGAPHTDGPRTDAPYAETSYANTFRTDIPGTEAPRTDAPRTDAHTNTSRGDVWTPGGDPRCGTDGGASVPPRGDQRSGTDDGAAPAPGGDGR